MLDQINDKAEPPALQLTPVGGTCLSCKFSVGVPGAPVGQRHCRRMPPAATSMALPTGPNKITFHTHSSFPAVEVAWWCGEYRSRAGGN